MEALQILKFGLKKERLAFNQGLATSKESLIGIDPAVKGKDPLADYLRA
jgi:hypothetical protein